MKGNFFIQGGNKWTWALGLYRSGLLNLILGHFVTLKTEVSVFKISLTKPKSVLPKSFPISLFYQIP